MRTLNLGILAHVDAGKTSLTERLLHAAGVIDEVGSVDDGSTQTDSLALERQRGITIKSAVVSFVVGDVTVNLIDTPGHPDFIAEVERVLSVLDGAVLVVSAVEGVQAQTRILMRALRRLRIPTLIFVNKIDRVGADCERVLRSIAEKLTPAVVPMGTASGLGTRGTVYVPHPDADADFTSRLVDVLTEHDEALTAAYVDDETALSYERLRDELAAQTRRALAHPVFFGSAMTGAGVDALTAAITKLLPCAEGDADRPVSGTVFKVERGPAGEKVAYVRLFSGTARVRDRLQLGHEEGKVTAIHVFERGLAEPCGSVVAGQIGKLWGLGEVRIGDAIGTPQTTVAEHHFAPPTLEAVVAPRHLADKGRLHVALTQLAEQDPLINLRQDDIRQEMNVSLYGEVQKEVIQATLADDYGIAVSFRESTTLCIERPVGAGEAVELLQEESNPFRATIGLRIDPAPHGSGIEFRLRIESRAVPTHIYKNVNGFTEMMGQYVRRTLREGLFGWQVTDCVVTMINCEYSVADGPPSTRGPDSTAADFRKLTPLVLMDALKQAGTRVCEPIHRYQLELPADTLGAVLPVLARLGTALQAPVARGSAYLLEGGIPAARVHELQQKLPALTRGEGVLESAFHRYQPVRGAIPTRPRSDRNPLNRKEYLLHVVRRV
ncbi:MAG: GTP-binding protein [Micromonosporaceae bacterium]|nr:GTP-binding protein [Micromonosporaceae bacterium]